MTKKDYELIAGAINEAWVKSQNYYEEGSINIACRDAIREVAGNIGNKLNEDNPRFNPFKFEEACFKI